MSVVEYFKRKHADPHFKPRRFFGLHQAVSRRSDH
jgi:hypothetical protein